MSQIVLSPRSYTRLSVKAVGKSAIPCMQLKTHFPGNTIPERRGADFCLIVVEKTREYGQLLVLLGHLGTLGSPKCHHEDTS